MTKIEVKQLSKNSYAPYTAMMLTISFFLFGCSQVAEGTKGIAADQESYKVGAIVFLTGPQASLGVEVKNALDIAAEDINNSGGIGGKRVEILYEDSKDSPKDAILAFNKLSMSNVPVVLSTGDVVTCNLAPMAKQKMVPIVSTVVAGPGITKDNEWVFRVFIDAEKQAESMARLAAKELKRKSAAILYINNEFGVATNNEFKKTFESLGGKVSATETFGIMDKDVRSQLSKLTAQSPDAVFVSGFGPAYAAAIRQLKEQSYKGTVLTVSTLSIPYFMEQTKSANEGVYFPDTAFQANSTDPVKSSFVKSYETKYHSKPCFVGAFAYDTLKLVQAAAKESSTTKTSLRESLAGLSSQEGLVGKIKFDAKRELDFPLIVKRIDHGEARQYCQSLADGQRRN